MDYVQRLPWDSGSQSVISRTETSALLGKVLEMPFWSPVPTETAMVGVDEVQGSVLYQAL